MATAQEKLGKKIFNSLTKQQRAYLIKTAGLNNSFTEAEKSKLLNGWDSIDLMGESAIEKIANTNPVSSLAVSAVKVFGNLFKKKKKKATTPAVITEKPTTTTTSSKIPVIPIAIGAGVIVLILVMKKRK